jgi:hypothetical protein
VTLQSSTVHIPVCDAQPPAVKTATLTPMAAATPTATLAPVISGLPATGGGMPIRPPKILWDVTILGGFGAAATY